MSVFNWIRDGVRRSVIQGVSDAITQIGVPDQSDDLHPQLANMLGTAPVLGGGVTSSLPAPTTSGAPARKRLGKSFEQIRREGDPT